MTRDASRFTILIQLLELNSMGDGFCQCESIMFLCQPERWMVSSVLWERAVPVAKPATVSLSLVLVVRFGLHDWSCCYQHYRFTSHRFGWQLDGFGVPQGWKEGMFFPGPFIPTFSSFLAKLRSCGLLCREYQCFIPSIYVMHCLLLFCVTTVLSDYPQCSFSRWTLCFIVFCLSSAKSLLLCVIKQACVKIFQSVIPLKPE